MRKALPYKGPGKPKKQYIKASGKRARRLLDAECYLRYRSNTQGIIDHMLMGPPIRGKSVRVYEGEVIVRSKKNGK